MFQTIRYKVLERGLPMSVLDAEYQFDRHKLTFFFEAEKRIDFRELVSELFSLYKTRIWMQQVDTTALPAHDPGTELAKATGFLPERDEYSYIAPTILTPGGNSSITTSMNNTEDTARYAPLSSPHKENFGIKKETEKSRMRSSTEDNINHNISMEELNEMMTKTCVDRGVNKTPDNNKDF